MKWRPRYIQNDTHTDHFRSAFLYKEGKFQFPDESYIISCDKEGNPLSRYGDDIWDLSTYSVKTVKLDFYAGFDLNVSKEKKRLIIEIANEMKMLMWLFMWEPFHNSGLSYSPGTLRNYLSALRGIASIAYGESRSLQSVHESPTAFHKIFLSLNQDNLTHTVARQLNTWGNTINFIVQHYKVEIPQLFEKNNLRRLQGNIPKQRRSHSEAKTPLIPTRLYAQLLSDSKRMVDDFLIIADRLLEMMARYYKEPSFWINPSYITLENGTLYTNWRTITFYRRWNDCFAEIPAPSSTELHWTTPEEAVKQYDLIEYFEKYSIYSDQTHGKNNYNWFRLTTLLSVIQTSARTMLFSYTGQRLHENTVLTVGCLSSMTIKGLGELPLVMGRTSKMTNNNYSEELLPWASSIEIIPAINAAEKIAKFAVSSIHKKSIDKLNENEIPLFIGLQSDKQNSVHFNFPIKGYLDSRAVKQNFLKVLNSDPATYIINEEDMQELCDFDVYRNWRNDRKIKKGDLWPFSSHQFRRATAVYSARSGIVSLPSLKFQFKHLHVAMTMLYRENALFAKNILAETPDPGTHAIISDFMTENNMIMAAGLKSHIMDSQLPLTGGAGYRLQQMKESSYPKYWDSEESLAKEINNGTIRWEQVPTGGCMKIGICKHKGIDDVLPCRTGCSDSVMGGEDGLGEETGHFLSVYKDEMISSLDFIDAKHPAAGFIQQEVDTIESLIKTQRDITHEK